MKTHVAFLCAGSVALTLVACKAKVQPSIVLELQTDMAMPKDVALFAVSVRSGRNTQGYSHEFPDDEKQLATEDGYRIPLSIVLETTTDQPEPVHIEVTAYADEKKCRPRVKAVVDTVIPDDRIVRLPLSMDFLCSDTAVSVDGKCESEVGFHFDEPCSDAHGVLVTCLAGSCESSVVDSSKLDPFDPETDGPGQAGVECFDTAKCFAEEAHDFNIVDGGLGPDAGPNCADGGCPCVAEAQGGAAFQGHINVGLKTPGAGMCNGEGCFVALNFGSRAGWDWVNPADQRYVKLPRAVCTKIAKGKIGGVIWRSAGPAPCEPKIDILPTCGPWSPSGKKYLPPANDKDPVVLASGQLNPQALFVQDDLLYWITQGTLESGGLGGNVVGGTVNAIPRRGGVSMQLAFGQPKPSALQVVTANAFDHVLWTNEGNPLGPPAGSLHGVSFNKTTWTLPQGTPEQGIELVPNLHVPRGLAVFPLSGQTGLLSVFLTEALNPTIQNVHVDANTEPMSRYSNIIPDNVPAPGGMFPTSIAATSEGSTRCWCYADDFGQGGVACEPTKKPLALNGLEPDQSAHDVVVFVDNGPISKTRAFWITSNHGGEVRTASMQNGSWSPVTTITTLPALTGLAVDTKNRRLYVSSVVNKTIYSLDFDGNAAPTPEVTGRANLGVLAVDDENIYWIEQGTPGTHTGRILRMGKK